MIFNHENNPTILWHSRIIITSPLHHTTYLYHHYNPTLILHLYTSLFNITSLFIITSLYYPYIPSLLLHPYIIITSIYYHYNPAFFSKTPVYQNTDELFLGLSVYLFPIFCTTGIILYRIYAAFLWQTWQKNPWKIILQTSSCFNTTRIEVPYILPLGILISKDFTIQFSFLYGHPFSSSFKVTLDLTSCDILPVLAFKALEVGKSSRCSNWLTQKWCTVGQITNS